MEPELLRTIQGITETSKDISALIRGQDVQIAFASLVMVYTEETKALDISKDDKYKLLNYALAHFQAAIKELENDE